MDPFSLTVGVAGLLSLIVQTVQVARSFQAASRDAVDQAASLVAELEAVQLTVNHLDAFLKEEASKGSRFDHTSALRSTTLAFESKLSSLCLKLRSTAESRMRRLRWPLNREEHLRSIQDLRAFAAWIEFSLSLDSCSLLSRTSDDVLYILQQQTETLRALREIERQSLDLKNVIEDQTALLREERDAADRRDMLNWISQLDSDAKHNAVRLPRAKGTGGWLLEHPRYLEWRDRELASNVLWCHGIQGCGKSVLASLVIDQLKESYVTPNQPLAFWYFDYRNQHQQLPETVVASILKQAIALLPIVPTQLREARLKSSGSKKALPLQELIELFLSISHGVNRVFLVIDALDECDPKHRGSFLELIEQLKSYQAIRVFVTSRSHPPDIRRILDRSPRIEIIAHESDLRQYMGNEVREACQSGIIDQHFATNIIEKLIRGANGLYVKSTACEGTLKPADEIRFLLAVLQLRAILKEPTAGDMEDALDNISDSLAEAFEETISRIRGFPTSRRRLAMKALLWTCHAKRLLTATELVEAIAVTPGQTASKPKYRPSINLIIDCCQGLLSIDPGTGIVRIVHYSVQEYLVQESNKIFPNAHIDIAQICLTYILFDEFKGGPRREEEDLVERLASYPLLPFVASHGFDHVNIAASDPGIATLVKELLASRGAMASCSQAARYCKGYWEIYWSDVESWSYTPLHFAAYYNMKDAAYELLQGQSEIVNNQTHIGTTPLILAASKGHIEVVRMLLANGADPYLQNWYGNSLHCAAEAGHLNTIQELLDYGVDPIATSDLSKTALHCALDHDLVEAADILIDGGANIDAHDSDGMSVFHRAVDDNNRDTVELLLTKFGVDVDSPLDGMPSGRCATALHVALANEDEWMITRLLKAGATLRCTRLSCELSHQHFEGVMHLQNHLRVHEILDKDHKILDEDHEIDKDRNL